MSDVFKCPFCGRDDIYRKSSFTLHIKYCKENPDRVEFSVETRKKMSEALKGRQTRKGKTHSEETRKKISESNKGKNKGKTRSEETKQKISEATKKAYENPEVRQKMIEAIKKAYENPKYKQKRSEISKRMWENPEVQQKRYDTMKRNNSFNSSKIEEQLKEYCTSHNINFKTQYKSKEYPFMCDFYFPDKDLYVEIQGCWTHGGKPYIEDDLDCIEQLELWKSKNKPFYLNAIDTWTIRDVRKRNYAKEHGLNWIEIFSDDFETCITEILKLL